MEDLSPVQTTPPPQPPTEVPIPNSNSNPNPPNTAQNPPSQPPPPPSAPPTLPQQSKKRPLDQNGHTHHSNYFKLRAVVKDLRPHFIEVYLNLFFLFLEVPSFYFLISFWFMLCFCSEWIENTASVIVFDGRFPLLWFYFWVFFFCLMRHDMFMFLFWCYQ